MKKANKLKATTRRKPQTRSKNRKQGMRPVEMWVLVVTLLLITYLVTQVRTPEGLSFMTTMIEEVNHEGN